MSEPEGRSDCRVCATKAAGLPTPGYTHDPSCTVYPEDRSEDEAGKLAREIVKVLDEEFGIIGPKSHASDVAYAITPILARYEQEQEDVNPHAVELAEAEVSDAVAVNHEADLHRARAAVKAQAIRETAVEAAKVAREMRDAVIPYDPWNPASGPVRGAINRKHTVAAILARFGVKEGE